MRFQSLVLAWFVATGRLLFLSLERRMNKRKRPAVPQRDREKQSRELTYLLSMQ